MIEEKKKPVEPDQPAEPDQTSVPSDPLILEQRPLAHWLREALHNSFKQSKKKSLEQKNQARVRLAQDRTKTFLLLAVALVAVALLFLGVFSTPIGKRRPEGASSGKPNLGRKETPKSLMPNPAESRSVTPLLSADLTANPESSPGMVTENDIQATANQLTRSPAQTVKKPEGASANSSPYALRNIEFSDPLHGKPESSAEIEARLAKLESSAAQGPKLSRAGSMPAIISESQAKPSLVFVRSPVMEPAASADTPRAPLESSIYHSGWSVLPAGTRLMARLQSAISTAVATPVVGVIEYNYERDGEIIVPAGSKAFGKLQQANRSGEVSVAFHSLEMPSGETVRIDGVGLDLTLGPLKGRVEGKKTGTRFLVRSLTGIGTVASQVIGLPGGFGGLNGPITQGTLFRERLSNNVAQAGDQQLQELAIHQNVTVTIAGSTRFYIVLQEQPKAEAHSSLNRVDREPSAIEETARNEMLTRQDLREMKQLKQELSRLLIAAGSTRGSASQ
jgi:type IV secretory pathway VirB10-like protein